MAQLDMLRQAVIGARSAEHGPRRLSLRRPRARLVLPGQQMQPSSHQPDVGR